MRADQYIRPGLSADVTTREIQAAIDAIDDGGEVYFPPGSFVVNSTLAVGSFGTRLVGAGRYATRIVFKPTANDQPLFLFENTNPFSTLNQCSLESMSLISQGNNPEFEGRTAVLLHDVNDFRARDVVIDFYEPALKSKGIVVRGRDLSTVSGVTIKADHPIRIEKNDRNQQTESDLDQFNFHDLYLIVADGVGVDPKPCVFIDEGVMVHSTSFDGRQSWVKGTHGLYWVDSTSAGVSYGVTIKNVRTEQSQDATGHAIHIDKTGSAWLLDLIVENVVADLSQNGMFLRNVYRASLGHVMYAGTLTSLDADEVLEMEHRNCFWGVGSAPLMDNMQRKFSVHKTNAGEALPNTASYAQSVGLAPRQALEMFGANVWAFNGSIRNAGKITIPAGDNQGRKTSILFVSAQGSAGVFGGVVIDAAAGATLLSGTSNFGVANVPGSLFVLSTAALEIHNQTGSDLDVVAFLVFS